MGFISKREVVSRIHPSPRPIAPSNAGRWLQVYMPWRGLAPYECVYGKVGTGYLEDYRWPGGINSQGVFFGGGSSGATTSAISNVIGTTDGLSVLLVAQRLSTDRTLKTVE